MFKGYHIKVKVTTLAVKLIQVGPFYNSSVTMQILRQLPLFNQNMETSTKICFVSSSLRPTV